MAANFSNRIPPGELQPIRLHLWVCHFDMIWSWSLSLSPFQVLSSKSETGSHSTQLDSNGNKSKQHLGGKNLSQRVTRLVELFYYLGHFLTPWQLHLDKVAQNRSGFWVILKLHHPTDAMTKNCIFFLFLYGHTVFLAEQWGSQLTMLQRNSSHKLRL